MNKKIKKEILGRARLWFGREIIPAHILKIEEIVKKPSKLNINPFTVRYLAKLIEGSISSESLVKAVVYPRILGTSINTIFGNRAQSFISEVLEGFGSTTSGIDIEYTDYNDGQYKYCQLKAGPDTINKDDVKTIDGHFASVKRLAHTNNKRIGLGDLVIGILYGDMTDINGNYRALQNKHHYKIYVGKDFWHSLTGDHNFYFDLIKECAAAADEIDTKGILNEAVKKLSQEEVFKTLSS